jgi:hypothetical protein
LSNINTFGVNSTASNYVSTIPAQAAVVWTADAEMHFLPAGTGNIVVTAAAGVSLNGVVAGSITLSTAYGAATLKRVAADSWVLMGVAGQLGASGDWAASGGAADAYTLTPVVSRESYATGDQFRARFSVTNTGATTVNVSGLGTKTCVTVTGVALPAGYIRTDVDTVLSYNGTSFVVGREVEYGSNANGEFWRHADGRQSVLSRLSFTGDISNALGSLFSTANITYTTPAAYLSGGECAGSVCIHDSTGGNLSVIGGRFASNGISSLRLYAGASLTGITITYGVQLEGTWY